ncbi:MAG: GTP 3',8-cyclase MoaA [Acidobacteriota bacterium]
MQSGTGSELKDALGRSLKDLRVSVTDRCNFRCSYCMPLEKYEWIDRHEILSFEEITRLVNIFVLLGVEEVRLTGGEPLLRHDLTSLIKKLSDIKNLKDLSLTTNASLLRDMAPKLAESGLNRVNVSLDTVHPEKFREMTRMDDLGNVLNGLAAAAESGLTPIKINSVIQRGVNESDIADLVRFSREHGYQLRFIEYMDVGNSNNWVSEKMVPKSEILRIVQALFPLQEGGRVDDAAPAIDYRYKDGKGNIGIIASVTEPFCTGCTRARLTADGKLVLCLFSDIGLDLKRPMRDGASNEEMRDIIRSAWSARNDRFSEERLEAMKSGDYRPESRKKIEMISLGG